MKILVLGQSGFLGSSIIEYTKIMSPDFEFPKFTRKDFFSPQKLDSAVSESDIIILLSAVCRGLPDDEIYNINMTYVDFLIGSLERIDSKKTIVFSSSIQEDDNSGYGRSKKDGRTRLASWCFKRDYIFLGLILPNIFGPNARVNYASFIATFSNSIFRGQKPAILIDKEMSLLYVENFVRKLLDLISKKVSSDKIFFDDISTYKVSEVLSLLYYFMNSLEKGEEVVFKSNFEIELYNTFLSYE